MRHLEAVDDDNALATALPITLPTALATTLAIVLVTFPTCPTALALALLGGSWSAPYSCTYMQKSSTSTPSMHWKSTTTFWRYVKCEG